MLYKTLTVNQQVPRSKPTLGTGMAQSNYMALIDHFQWRFQSLTYRVIDPYHSLHVYIFI